MWDKPRVSRKGSFVTTRAGTNPPKGASLGSWSILKRSPTVRQLLPKRDRSKTLEAKGTFTQSAKILTLSSPVAYPDLGQEGLGFKSRHPDENRPGCETQSGFFYGLLCVHTVFLLTESFLCGTNQGPRGKAPSSQLWQEQIHQRGHPLGHGPF